MVKDDGSGWHSWVRYLGWVGKGRAGWQPEMFLINDKNNNNSPKFLLKGKYHQIIHENLDGTDI